MLQEDIATWQVPAIALTKNTALGAAPFEFYRPTGDNGPRMDEQFDAILYLGPVSSITIWRGEVSPITMPDAVIRCNAGAAGTPIGQPLR